jgi:NADPH-dependent glutamate synthase beta subunit-like oxidoreductase
MSSHSLERPFAITLEVGSSLANHTGSWRTERPEYVRMTAPCGAGCPAAEDVQQWLYHAEEGGYEAAWRKIMERNPFPAICGRVCYHPCETACNRAQLDEAVGINSVERFLGDQGIANGWSAATPATPSGKRVLVVGAGPSGLSAAYHLAMLGHAVTVRDMAPAAGGMMRYGIPKYRLPREVLDAEVQRIADLGVTFQLGEHVADVIAEQLAGHFDAVFLAVGAQLPQRAYVPAGSAAKVLEAIALLRDMEDGSAGPPLLGRRVAVYGGGNTAMDAARTARRLGAEEAVIVYRRTRDRMPAHESELQEALQEGIQVKWLTTIKYADAGSLKVERMQLDESGYPQPTGEYEELEADSVVLATGQVSDLSLLEGVPGIEQQDRVVKVDANLMTGASGIFAGGDMVPAQRTVTVAIGHGRRAAHGIDRWLRGALPAEPPETHDSASLTGVGPEPLLAEVPFERLNAWYYSDAPKTVREQLDAVRRCSTFDEVVLGLDESNALFEARRCLSCGNCLACDNCYGVCPDNAVIKLEPVVGAGGWATSAYAYAFDLDFCKGCGLCAQECPCGAIQMQPEPT